MGKLFGTDGVRGIANVKPMTAEMALAIGLPQLMFANGIRTGIALLLEKTPGSADT